MHNIYDSISSCNTSDNIHEIRTVPGLTKKANNIDYKKVERDNELLKRILMKRSRIFHIFSSTIKYASWILILPFYLIFIVIPKSIFKLVLLCKKPVERFIARVLWPIKVIFSFIKRTLQQFISWIHSKYVKITENISRKYKAFKEIFSKTLYNLVQPLWKKFANSCTKIYQGVRSVLKSINDWMKDSLSFCVNSIRNVSKRFTLTLFNRAKQLKQFGQYASSSSKEKLLVIKKASTPKRHFWSAISSGAGSMFAWVRVISKYAVYIIKEMIHDMKQLFLERL
jgi:hypothetical protein